MARKRKLDAETARLWDRLDTYHPDYPDSRKASILSAYRGYREKFGSQLVSNVALRGYLDQLFGEKGIKQGYAVAMHLRDALRTLWGDDAAATVTRYARDLQPQTEVTLRSEWDAVRGAVAHLPATWRAPFDDFVTRCETNPPDNVLSPFTLKSMAEALLSWARFRQGNVSGFPTGTELNDYAVHLVGTGVWMSTVLSRVTRVYMCYTHILTPGFRSDACQAVLRDLNGRAETAGSYRKKPEQIVPASLLYRTGQEMMTEAQTGPSHNIRAATLYRNGLLLTVAAALPLRRRALASLDLATSFRLEARPIIHIDISGHYLKLRHAEKDYQRYRAELTSPVLWDAVHVWQQRFRPMFDDSTALWPSLRIRGEALAAGYLGQIFGETTAARIGVRVPIHRIRDCVATEAIEEMEHGAGWARFLLDHRSADTTNRFYDHSTGVAVSREFGQLVTERRSDPVDLIL